uniref:Uncharacterized protein n=1 Tax=viral metagenome TaxID=1070528 RepID=A0A6C0B1Q8_9ZZZZ
MATLADAQEELRIAKVILQIAKENHYSKVVTYLEQNVLKAQKAVDAFGGFSPSKMLFDFFEIVAPRSPQPELPFTTVKSTTPIQVVVNYSEPHYV